MAAPEYLRNEFYSDKIYSQPSLCGYTNIGVGLSVSPIFSCILKQLFINLFDGGKLGIIQIYVGADTNPKISIYF